jgi:hypothetical protein
MCGIRALHVISRRGVKTQGQLYKLYLSLLQTLFCRLFFDKFIVVLSFKKFPALWKWKVRHHIDRSPPSDYPEPVEFSPQPHTLFLQYRFYIILSHVVSFSWRFPTIILYIFIVSPRRAACPTHFILRDFIARTIQCDNQINSNNLLLNHLKTNCVSCRLSPRLFPTPAMRNIVLYGWKSREGKRSLGNWSSDQERRGFLLLAGARVNSSATAGNALFFGLVTLPWQFRDCPHVRYLPFRMKTFTLHKSFSQLHWSYTIEWEDDYD